MSRVKRSTHARKKRRATLDRTKGYRGQAKSSYKRAKEALLKADSYAYAHRRTRKRDFRRLWITRINAAARQEGMSYSQFIHGLTPGRGGARPQGAGRHRRARPRDLPTVCRDGPGGRCCLTRKRNAESLPGRPARRPFSFRPHLHVITSPHNEQLKTMRKLQQRRWRDKLGLFSAEGEDLVAAAERAGWQPETLLRSGVDVEPRLLDDVSSLGSGSRVIGVYRAALVGALGPRDGLPARRGRPRQRRRGPALGPRALRRPGAAGAGLRRPVLAQGGAGEHGVGVRAAARGGAIRRACPGTRSPWTRGGERRWPRRRATWPPARPLVLCLGAEREGLPEEILSRAAETVRIPLREGGPESLNVAMAATVALYELGNRMARHV